MANSFYCLPRINIAAGKLEL